ncbi:hypothetical protein FWF93_02280 [Candidatus Saccharibacteria bacterium]|nr:hypothetical protein [Candidatus Saccharibacteria bacterium]
MFNSDKTSDRRNRPTAIVIVAVTAVVVVSAIGSFVKIGSELNRINTYSGAALQARQVLDNLERVGLIDIEQSTELTARENSERLQEQISAFRNSVYDLNHNKLITSDVDAHNIYTVIEIRAESLINDCSELVANLAKMADGEAYDLSVPNKETLKGRISDLVSYLEQKSLE